MAEDKRVDPLDPYADEVVGGPVVPQEPNTRRIHLPTVDTFVCLRGPCSYYWELSSPGEFVEVPGVEVPLAISRFCTYSRDATDLTDRTIVACNRWDPMDKSDHDYDQDRRAAYEKEKK